MGGLIESFDEARGDALSEAECEGYASSGERMSEVFACDLDALLHDDANDFIHDVVVFGDEVGYELVGWEWRIAGISPDERNMIALRVEGIVTRA